MSRFAATIRAAAALLLCLPHAARAGEGPVVVTADGPVRGTVADGVLSFKGIPYAQAPTGDRRWRPSQPPARWKAVRDAARFASDCPGAFPDRARMSEDCLYLNVWTAGTGARAKRPVMLWIYGGGFRGGSAAIPLFDGAELARRGVVLVSFGYRTGPLGFLALPELSAESPHGSSGNYGILDAVAVLRWVRANIARFGGDPGNVTIAGQSSGSETVNILTASPLAKGLFHRAIGESGSSFGVRRAPPLAEAERLGLALMRDRGAASLADLRTLPFDKLIASDAEKFEPNIDGWLLPADVHAIYAAGRQNDVPMLIGNTAQEFGRPPAITAEALRTDIAREYGALASAVAVALGEGDPTDLRWMLTNREWGDFPAATWSGLQARTGRAPVYRYLFDYAPPVSDGRPRIARHGAELGYVFGTQPPAAADGDTVADTRIRALVPGYWINFMRTGDPNGPGLPVWKPLGAAPGQYLRFGTDGAAETLARDAALIGLIGRRHYGATGSGAKE
ncbi:carboxylesterase/lipase family protein [Sphingomonas canadensis]|uniref:Carboxylic ester hydrolase n=1 Tax=Sphingomonas canadensis TaxID=1219257 RepID=A0ABW3H787_9SPHN|nr:carboxylesterase family protein [Sphingomonas canadensis]MCW3836989.1 carboxylesterase family protein [Sphingomonas canadensis]